MPDKTLRLIGLGFFAFIQMAFSQKLPKVQVDSVRSPANIKIDGKSKEWADNYKAYNPATDLFYTISNDDKTLFLIIKATDPDNINKIYNKGLTVTIDPSNKKNYENSVAITYPVFDQFNIFHTNLKNRPKLIPNDEASTIAVDSFLRVTNQQFSNKAKWLNVTISGKTDSLISVYNDEGFKAAALFDDKIDFVLEIGIPLEKLGLSINDLKKFSYQIRTNPLSHGDNFTRERVMGPNGKMVNMINANFRASDIPRIMNLTSVTDFWGEYTLAKKS